MIRILLILLAIVAAILAAVLDQPLMYVAAGVLLLIALGIILTYMRRRHRPQKKTPESPARRVSESPKEDDLGSLGILEIRPRSKGGTEHAPAGAPAEAVEAAAPAEAERPKVGAARRATAEQPPKEGAEAVSTRPRFTPGAAIAVKERTQSLHEGVDAGDDPFFKETVIPLLQALRAALDAHTVCLLRQEELALHYHIDAIVSVNAYARSGGSFTTRGPLLNASEARKPVTVRRVSESGIPQGSLGYYREPIAVRQIAMAPVQRPGDPTISFLLADVMQLENGLGTSRRRTLLAQFAELLGTLMEVPAAEESAAEEEGGMRPRRDIIAEEMEKARAHRRALALALVYLNRAEAVADAGAAEVEAAEQALAARLHQAVKKGRVERFGELTYGIFYKEKPAEVEAWALKLQQEMAGETGYLAGGISIGIALLQDRHEDADDFRADATEALREAYETGTCVILE